MLLSRLASSFASLAGGAAWRLLPATTTSPSCSAPNLLQPTTSQRCDRATNTTPTTATFSTVRHLHTTPQQPANLHGHKVVPDVVNRAPYTVAKVCFKSGATAQNGNIISPDQAKCAPTVTWPSHIGKRYTLCMLDADFPSRANPAQRQWNHWLVGNIPCCEVGAGTVLAEYVAPLPGLGTGIHRYVLLVYRQKACEPLKFDCVPRLHARSATGRTGFSVREFASKFDMGEPVAANFFFAEYDCYVPRVLQLLGLAKACDKCAEV